MPRLFNTTKKKISATVFLTVFLAFFVFLPVTLADTGAEEALKGLKQSAAEGYEGTGKGSAVTGASQDISDKVITDIPTTIGKIVGAILAFVGIIFFVLIIYGGFTWMTAQGNEQEVTKAKNLIYAAVVGLVIVLAAYAITTYLGGLLAEQ